MSEDFRTAPDDPTEEPEETPWGPVQIAETMATGVELVETAGHGGLILSRDRWESLPEEVRSEFMNPGYAEEDLEADIALTLLGLASPLRRDCALLTAREYPRYAPALSHVIGVTIPGCWTCGEEEDAGGSVTLAPGRRLCRTCFDGKTEEQLQGLTRLAGRAAG